MHKAQHLILYDGICGFCNASVQFMIRHDTQKRFAFASLQSDLGSQIVLQYGGDPTELSTFYLVEDYQGAKEKLRIRGKGGLYALHHLGGLWTLPALLRFLPAPILNLGYNLIAHFRYRIFGKLEACPVPSPETKERFLG